MGAAFLVVGFDFHRFAKKKKIADALGTDAGGVLFIQGRKTYYKKTNGTRRKIADYAFDLNPGSPDMEMFTRIMEQARTEMQRDASDKKAAAVRAMKEVAANE